jgi:hypothetical protein
VLLARILSCERAGGESFTLFERGVTGDSGDGYRAETTFA